MKLQFVISNLYCAIHYCAVILVGVSIYLLLLEDAMAGRLIIVLAIVSFLLECYWWCSIAESFQSVVSVLVKCTFSADTIFSFHRIQHWKSTFWTSW